MKHYSIRTAACIALLAATSAGAGAFDLKSVLGQVGNALDGVKVEDVASGIIDGVFSKSDISLADLAGVWQTTGSAVTFRSDSFLQKAGGSATAAVVESKIDPYLKQYGLLDSKITITPEGEITLQTAKATLRGTIKPSEGKSNSGNFTVQFKAAGMVSLGTFDTYVEMVQLPLSNRKSVKIMFDADKIQKLMKGIALISKSKLAKTASDLLNQYEGICVGFECDYAGEAPAATGTSNQESTPTSTGDSTQQQSGKSVLQNLLRNSRNKK